MVVVLAAPLRHFIFGYGSLMCSQSRAITSPEQSFKTATPVIVKGLQREWCKRVDRVGNRYTALGVQFDERATCGGVVLPVSEHELENFDERENGYSRTLLPAASIDLVPFLDGDRSKFDDSILVGNLNHEDPKRDTAVWVYIPKQPLPPTRDYPILQSYVDIVLRGCLSFSEKFALDFVETTKGWSPYNESRVGYSHLLDHDKDRKIVWVDDRNNPKYKRSDPQYSRSMATELDRLLLKVKPDHFLLRQRLPYDQ